MEREVGQTVLRYVESAYAYKNNDFWKQKPRPAENGEMKTLGFPLIYGDFLARSVRGISCAPPVRVCILND